MKTVKRLVAMLLALVLLVGLVPIKVLEADAVTLLSLAQLKEKFPNGKYWNHYVNDTSQCYNYFKSNGINNAYEDTVSNSACWSHSESGYSGYVHQHDCNRFDGATQCNGFAYKLGYDAYGSKVRTWSTTTSISSLKPGDVVHYRGAGADAEWGHWVFVISVSGSTITVGECNWGGKCLISWGRSFNLNSASSYTIYSAPYALSTDGSSLSYEIDTRYPTPFKANTLLWWNTSDGKTPVYDSINGNHSGNIYNGYNNVDDSCTIEEIYTNGWCKITVPGIDGERYCQTSVFLNLLNGYSPWWVVSPRRIDAYRRWDHGSPSGYIDQGDDVCVVSETESMYQVLIPTSSGYICRWVDRCLLRHVYDSVVTNPTCTAQGYTAHICKYCGDSYQDSYTTVLNHSYSYKVTKNPTTGATGTLTGSCSRCSGTTAVTLPKLNTTDYSYVVKTAATCTADGVGRYTWKTTTYGTFTFDVAIGKTGHSYSYKVTKNPTTSATGTLTGTCSKCSGTTTVTLPKLNTTDYSYAVKTAATCTADGVGRYTWKTTTYGTFTFDVAIGKTGHSYSYKVTKNPTTGATGTLTGSCSRCSGTTAVTLPKLNTTDYSYVVKTAATCTADGVGRYTWKTTTYGTFTFDVAIAKTGHSFSSGKCTRCGANDPAYVVNPNAPQIVVSSVKGGAGDTVTVLVDLKNNPGFSGLNLYVTYSDSLTLVETVSMVDNLTFTSDKTMVWDGVSDYVGDGTLLKLVFRISDAAEAGKYDVKVHFVEAFTAELDDVIFTTVDGYVEVIDCVYGDANGDGIVNTKDIILIRRHVAAKDPATGVSAIAVEVGADANGDGIINTKDIILVRRHVAAKDPVTGESSVVLGPQ